VVVGSSGSEKTWWSAGLMRATLEARVSDVVFVHDGKDPTPQEDYLRGGATVFPTVVALMVAPPDPVPSVIVFHSRDKLETPDGIASAATAVAGVTGQKICFVIDEIYDAMKARQTFLSGTEGPTAEIFRKGRSRGLSIVVGTQIPQTLPTDVTDLADTVAIGRLKRRSFKYISREWDLEPEMLTAIRSLKRGEFVLLNDSDDATEWDRTVYGPN
jgi:hypothetical protein